MGKYHKQVNNIQTKGEIVAPIIQYKYTNSKTFPFPWTESPGHPAFWTPSTSHLALTDQAPL